MLDSGYQMLDIKNSVRQSSIQYPVSSIQYQAYFLFSPHEVWVTVINDISVLLHGDEKNALAEAGCIAYR